MIPKVAKIESKILRNSRFEIAKRMASRYEIRYLTEKQASQLKRYGIYPIYLSQEERIKINSMIESKKKSRQKANKLQKRMQPCKVIFKSEGETQEVNFDSLEEANNWISYQESLKVTGEKFTHISTQLLTPSGTSQKKIN